VTRNLYIAFKHGEYMHLIIRAYNHMITRA